MTARVRKCALADELGRRLDPAELELAAASAGAAAAGASGLVDQDPPAIASGVWIREPLADRRIRHGDDFAGDAWRHIRTGELRYTAVGREISSTASECARANPLATAGREEGAHG